MIGYIRTATIVASMLFATSGSTLPAQVRPLPGGGIAQRMITVPCCRCINGESTRVSFDTGSAPWLVNGPNVPLPTPVVPAANPAWIAIPPANWVGPGAPALGGRYIYQIQFRVPRCIIPSSIQITGSFAADNDGKLTLDGQQIAVTMPPGRGFTRATPFSAPVGYIPNGIHTIRVEVSNAGGPTGLNLAGMIIVNCSRELEQGPTKAK